MLADRAVRRLAARTRVCVALTSETGAVTGMLRKACDVNCSWSAKPAHSVHATRCDSNHRPSLSLIPSMSRESTRSLARSWSRAVIRRLLSALGGAPRPRDIGASSPSQPVCESILQSPQASFVRECEGSILRERWQAVVAMPPLVERFPPWQQPARTEKGARPALRMAQVARRSPASAAAELVAGGRRW